MNIQRLILNVHQMDSTCTTSKEARWIAHLCQNFLSHASDLQKHFVQSLLLSGFESYGIGFFSQVSFDIIGSSWAMLLGVESELLELLFEGARTYVERQPDGEIFEGWQKLNHIFTQRLARRLLSLSNDEDSHIWMFASGVLNKCALEKSWDHLHLPGPLKASLKEAYAEALAEPLHILAWRLQSTVITGAFSKDKSFEAGEGLLHASRLAALAGMTAGSISSAGLSLVPESPFTVKALLNHWGRLDVRAAFNIELVEDWLTRGTGGTLDFHLLNELFADAFAAKLFFQVPMRISPKIFDKGYGPTTQAIKIAAPFQQLIASALVRPQEETPFKKSELVLT